MEVINNLLIKQEGDPFTIEIPPLFFPFPPLNSGVDSLVIRRIQALSTQNAVNVYNDASKTQLVHLFIGQNGSEIIQMVPFNRKVGYSWGFNRTAISLGLVNRGEILVGEKYKNHYNYIDKYDGDFLNAFGVNDNRFRLWASYPAAQLELLGYICQVLIQHYPIKSIHAYEDLVTTGLDPGPSFPKVYFFEALKTTHPTLDLPLRVLDETSQEVRLHHHPQEGASMGAANTLPVKTPIAVIDENAGWSLVEVMDDSGDKKWLKGWVQSNTIQMQKLTPVVVDHFLVTDKGRRYTFLEAAGPNFNNREDSNKPKYLVMHFTTGTEMRQTINTFRNPSQGVSTHLLIGRDGRVIQFVPFNKAAHHCGFSYWDNQSGLNSCTIGIELDNAGYLSRSADGQNWMRKGTVIPPGLVKKARHIKDYGDRHWECFPDQQLEVAFAIAQALVKEYNLVDILGHDQVNVKFRKDPGPLFEEYIRKWRQELFDRQEAAFEEYQTKGEGNGGVRLYRDHLGKKPLIDHPLVPGIRLRFGRVVQVIEKEGLWWKIRVHGGQRAIGWVRSRDIRVLPRVTKINRDNAPFYQVLTSSNAGPPATEHTDSPLSPGSVVRIQKFEGDMALIATTVIRNEIERLIEGWVRRMDIHKVS